MELKFRAWDGEEIVNINEALRRNLVGFQCEGNDGKFEPFFDGVVIMQYTGEKDARNKEIYEGDIIRETYYSYEEPLCDAYYIVKEAGFGYALEPLKGNVPESFYTSEIRIEGNIYENKDMMEVFDI